MNDLKVDDVMTHLVVTFRPQDSIQEAARRLLRNRISGAPVVKDGRIVGVVSEADLVRKGSSTVGDVMSTDLVITSPGTSVWEAAALIDRRGIRRLPVVDDEGYVMGVLTRSDLVRAMALTVKEAI